VEDSPKGDGIILSFIARSEDELLGWVLSFGRRAECWSQILWCGEFARMRKL